MDDVIALFHRYKDPVYRLALSFTGSPAPPPTRRT